jgi:hypothetical protein
MSTQKAVTPSFYFIQGGRPVKFAKNKPTMYTRRGNGEQYTSMVKHFIQNIPDGVSFTPVNPKNWGEISMDKNETSAPKNKELGDSEICQIGDFTINIGVVEKASLLSMRLILPAEGYKILKNRKNARI